MIQENGELSSSDIDSANIPVHINFNPREDDSDGNWELTANNYMPRKDVASQNAYEFIGPKDELANLIRDKIIPLYQNAVGALIKMACGEEGSCYYWDEVE